MVDIMKYVDLVACVGLIGLIGMCMFISFKIGYSIRGILWMVLGTLCVVLLNQYRIIIKLDV